MPHDRLQAFVARNAPSPPADAVGTVFHQEGELRLSPDGGWMPFTAEQHLRADRTEFVWHARFRMAPLVTGVVEDAYIDGEGRLDAKIWGFLPVAHGRGVDIDRGEIQRYLAESAWCPPLLLRNPDLHVEPGPDGAVRLWVQDPDTYVDLHFDAAGDVVRARTLTRKHGEVQQPWEGRFFDYVDFDGLRVPTGGEVHWETPDGDFVYWRGTITDVAWLREEGG